MPDLTGYTYSAARDALAAMGIFITTPSSISNPDTQSILSQSVEAEKEIAHGTVVTVTLVTSDDAMLGRY
jgi:beta-lactam-binding protein with PASTA domain